MSRFVPSAAMRRCAGRLWRSFLPGCLLLAAFAPAAYGGESWESTFEETCSRTSEAMTLSLQELEALLQKCHDLEKVIETREESVRKVYLKRLSLCKNLYAYVVEYKKGGEGAR